MLTIFNFFFNTKKQTKNIKKVVLEMVFDNFKNYHILIYDIYDFFCR